MELPFAARVRLFSDVALMGNWLPQRRNVSESFSRPLAGALLPRFMLLVAVLSQG